ncbi:unnamed protein product [Durusdinium trenchii]|uniref:Uncharacterized protein n=1 Tax=Durusdinium trenchii TaxID=1381693 RepID=A0ABP0S9J2_9DINO
MAKCWQLLLLSILPHAVGWKRECEVACINYHQFQASLQKAKSKCEKDSDCSGVVDFSGNGGKHALCKTGAPESNIKRTCTTHI